MDSNIRSGLEELLRQLNTDQLQSKKVTVAGGAGFIGSWICDLLILAHSRVYCIDNLSTGLVGNIDHLSGTDDFVFRQSDVAHVDPRDERCDIIMHLASRASPEEYQQHPIETLDANSQGTRNLLEQARKNDACLVYASTSEAYGDAEVIPTPETYWGNVNPIGLRSCYDEGKRFGEALCMAYHRAYDLDVRIVRIFNTYGPRLRSDGFYGRALSRFIDQAISGKDITVYGKGDQTRSFCYITDTVGGILRAAMRNEARGHVVNIGNPHEVSILQLAENIKAATGSGSKITFHPRPPDDPQRRCPDIAKAKSVIGWSPTVTLEEGLRNTIDWYSQRSRVAG